MGLKQSIVVVSRYTVSDGKGGGSRGGTPGDYVLRYMSREDAIESGLPQVQDGYMTRQDAVESAGRSDDEAPEPRMRRHKRYRDGVAFGTGNASLSHNELVGSSKDIQKAFENGKTVMETVLSFDEAYLKEHGIIPEDFVFEKKGDYRGNIDQMKLRYAIMHGMERLGRDYDDLKYVGVIQVDTGHVHCHLAMVDMGEGTVMPDGTQKGKISSQSIAQLRRGVDLYLDDMKEVQFMASSVDLDRRHMQADMKKYTYEQILMYGAPQRIMTALPEDDRLWRAGSNRKDMRQANKICRDYVEHIFTKPGSGIGEAMDHIRDYAATRQRREGLSEQGRLDLISRGRETLVQNCMNSVYATLRQVPKEQRDVSTPFLKAVAAASPAPSFKNDVQDFVYRAGAYHSRLSKHRNEVKKYAAFAEDYERSRDAGQVDPASQALYNYFIIERDYQAALAGKYSQMIFQGEPDDDYIEEYLEVSRQAKRLNAMRQLYDDPSARNMKPRNAEAYGQDRYGVYGGQYVVLDRPYFQARIDSYGQKYEAAAAALNARLSGSGLALGEPDGNGDIKIEKRERYDFESVKGLDLHDLRGDFSGNLEFSGDVRMAYMSVARRRLEAYEAACGYLDATGQGDLKEVFDAQDIGNMAFVLEKLEANQPIEPVEQPLIQVEDKTVIRLDKSMHRYISNLVRKNVMALEFTESLNLDEPGEDGHGGLE